MSIAGISFFIGVAVCVVIILAVVLIKKFSKCKLCKTFVSKDRKPSCVFVSETPIIQENPTYQQSFVKNEDNKTKTSVSSQNLVAPGRDSDYSLAKFKQQPSGTVVGSTISDAFSGTSPVKELPLDSNDLLGIAPPEASSGVLIDKEPDNETENTNTPDYENALLNTCVDEYQLLKETTADYQFPILKRGPEGFESPDNSAYDNQCPRSNLGDFQSLTENMMDYEVLSTGDLKSPSQSTSDYQFPKSSGAGHQSPTLNVARVRPTFLEFKEPNSQAINQYSPNSASQIKGITLQAPVTVVKEEKAVQTEQAEPEIQRESVFGYSKPKDTGERRAKQQDTTDNEYDYASFINLIKFAVQTSLKKKIKFDLQRTTSAMPCQQKPRSQFTFPDYNNEAHPVARSVSVKHSRRPQERLPMPLNKQQNSIEFDEDGISYFKKSSSTPALRFNEDTEDSPDSVMSPPYIDPNHLNPRVQQQQQHKDDSEDSDDDLMTMDDDFKDYVSTLKKQIPLSKGGQKTEKMRDSSQKASSTDSLPSGQIKVEIRRGDEKPSSGRRSSSIIHIELDDNILSHLAHKNEGDGLLPKIENEDESNDVYMEMGQDPIYGNIGQDQEEDYLPMIKIEKAHDSDDVYLCMDGVKHEDDKEEDEEEEVQSPSNFYITITG